MNTMCNQTNLRHRDYVNALRYEMGLPLHVPACDTVAYMFGPPVSILATTQLANIAVQVGRDIVNVSFERETTRAGVEHTVAFRLLDRVEILTNCKPFAAGPDSPVVLISADGERMFEIDARGCMTVRAIEIVNRSAGHALALRRIRTTARRLGNHDVAETRPVSLAAIPKLPVHSAPVVVLS